jgi:iron transport multicopper oxidase
MSLRNPDSHLINGRGRWNNAGTIDPSPLSVINVVPGQRYRFRIISLACDASYVFSIDGHTMTVIEADGVETDPITVDSVQVFAAQRYSVVVTANQGSGNFCEYQMIYLCRSWYYPS